MPENKGNKKIRVTSRCSVDYKKHNRCVIGVFMVGSEMLIIRFSNELDFYLGLGFITRAKLKMAATPLPLPVSLGMCVLM